MKKGIDMPVTCAQLELMLQRAGETWAYSHPTILQPHKIDKRERGGANKGEENGQKWAVGRLPK
jgi:hypothetical protein